jgi:hypothetical protein
MASGTGVSGRSSAVGCGSARPRRGAPKGRGQSRAPRRKSFTTPHSLRAHARKAAIFSLGVLHPRHFRPVVQKHVDPLKFCFANSGEGRFLGVEPADQAIGVLVRPALPGVVGPGKEHIHAGLPCAISSWCANSLPLSSVTLSARCWASLRTIRRYPA